MKRAFIFSEQINRREWWHSPPVDKNAYKKRGIFLSSSYEECEFYGRPLDNPYKVTVSNPIVDIEENIIKLLFGSDSPQMSAHKTLVNDIDASLKIRFKLDADLFKMAKKRNYDAIAIVTEKGLEKAKNGKLPKSVELNVFDVKVMDFFKGTDGKNSNKKK